MNSREIFQALRLHLSRVNPALLYGRHNFMRHELIATIISI